MDGKIKVFLEKIEKLEQFSGVASVWLQSEDRTESETAFDLQQVLFDLEEKHLSGGAEDGGDEYDNGGNGHEPDTNKFPINYFLDIEGDLYKASDIKSLKRVRNFEDGFNYWSLAINAHNTDYSLGISGKLLNFASEEERDNTMSDIKEKLLVIQNVRIIQ